MPNTPPPSVVMDDPSSVRAPRALSRSDCELGEVDSAEEERRPRSRLLDAALPACGCSSHSSHARVDSFVSASFACGSRMPDSGAPKNERRRDGSDMFSPNDMILRPACDAGWRQWRTMSMPRFPSEPNMPGDTRPSVSACRAPTTGSLPSELIDMKERDPLGMPCCRAASLSAGGTGSVGVVVSDWASCGS